MRRRCLTRVTFAGKPSTLIRPQHLGVGEGRVDATATEQTCSAGTQPGDAPVDATNASALGAHQNSDVEYWRKVCIGPTIEHQAGSVRVDTTEEGISVLD